MSVARAIARVRSLAEEAKWRGLWGTVLALKLNKFGTMKYFVHQDNLGNRYFENRNTSYGRDRWVEYSESKTPDSSKIPPEWHAWVHHIVDEKPSEHPLAKKSWEAAVTGNRTGTKEAYFPRNNPLSEKFIGLAKEKIDVWKPASGKREKVESGNQDLAEKDVYDLK